MRNLKILAALVLLVVVGFVVRHQYGVRRASTDPDAAAAVPNPDRAALPAPSAETIARREALLAELQPVTLSNCVLARVGAKHDGGYLMCANLAQGTTTAYSYGIGTDDYWGCAVSAAHKVTVHQYDCFAPTRIECVGAVFKLNEECVGPRTETIEGRRFDTIANQIAKNGDVGKRMLVKIDIEGAEWPTVLGTPDDVLAAIDQMPMELHGIDEPEVLDGLRKLKRHFHLLAVHFNNYACGGAEPLPARAYQVLLVNKRIGVVGPPPAGSPTAESLLAPDNPTQPDCQLPVRR
jgi:hypothetical protein